MVFFLVTGKCFFWIGLDAVDLELFMSINTKGSPMEMDEEKKPNPFWHLGIYRCSIGEKKQ